MAVYDAAGRDRIEPDPLLTDVSVSFERDANMFVSQRLAPTVRVNLQSGRYSLFGKRAFKQPAFGSKRAPGTRANQVEAGREEFEDTYFATEDALESVIPIEEYENNPDKDVRAEATEEVTGQLLVQKELNVINLVTTAGNYKASHVVTLGAGDHFDEYATSDPITVFRDLIRDFFDSTGITPNLGVFPWKVMSYLEDHPDILARYENRGGNISPENIAETLHLPEIVVPGGWYDSNTNPALASSLQEMWPDDILLAYVPARPARNTPALMYDFVWPIAGGQAGPDNFSTDVRYDDDNIADIVRVRTRRDLKLVGKDPEEAGTPIIAGALIKDVLS